MGPRVSVKALVIQNGQILLNRCEDATNGRYYTLPGGGQQRFEPLEHAVVREVLEETGYTIRTVQFAGLYEEIFTDLSLKETYPEYAHRLYPIFFCELCKEEQVAPTEQDMSQKDCVWIDLALLPSIRILPEAISRKLPTILSDKTAIFLGTDFTDGIHG